jgi:hypothetical protein
MYSIPLNLTEAEFQLLGQPDQALNLGELLARLAEASTSRPDPAASILIALLEVKLGLDRPADELLHELRGSGDT